MLKYCYKVVLNMDIKRMCEEISEQLISIRHDLHMNPELSNEEFRTQKKICDYLDKWGIEYTKGIANTGVLAIVRGKENGKTIALRADMDALPMEELTCVDFKSINKGIMHSCGHDAHVTILLGVAKIIKSLENEIKGNIKFFFQPAEETTGGAERMIKEGCMENPKVDAVLGLHVTTDIETGKIRLRYGKMNASSDEITIIVKGVSSHGAKPDKGVDGIVMASNIVLALQTLVSRNISPLNSVVFTIGTICGGSKSNVIAEEVKMNCILRTLDEETRQFMKKRIISVVENTAKAHGGTAEVIIDESYAPLINDDEMVNLCKEVAEETIGKENIIYISNPEMFAEDFSYFTQVAKSCFFYLGGRNEEKGCIYPTHSNKFNIDEDSFKLGVELQVKNVLKFLQ